MNNNDDLLKNYIESQKRQRELIEESKKRRDENNDKKLSSKTDHEKTDYLKDLKDYLEDAVIKNPDEREKFQEIKKRVTCLDLASKCKNEIDKIYFIDHDWIGGGGGTSDAEDETWREMMYSFLDQYDLNEDDYDFVFSEIESICFNKKRFCKNDKVLDKFKKIFTDVDELIKKFKLYIFASYFDDEPHSTYRGEIEWIKDTW